MADQEALQSLLAAQTRGVIVTLRPDGRPHLSNIGYRLGDDGAIRISVTDGRVKTKNLRNDPRASLHTASGDFWKWVVADGAAELSPVATQAGDEVCQELLALYESVRGEPHPDPKEFHEAMVKERRLVLRLRPIRLYGQA